MALPKKVEKLLDDKLSLIDDSVDNFNVENIQEQVFKELSRFLMKELDLDDDGNIKTTAKNLRAVQRMRKIRNIVLSDAYKAKVGSYIATFNTVQSLSNEYITEL